MALIAWATLGLTGLYSAWLHVGNIDALLHTGYGQALLTKLILLIPILALAAFNLFVVTRRLRLGDPQAWAARFRYLVASEAVLAVIVLAVVGALTPAAGARRRGGQTTGVEVSLTVASARRS